MGVLLAAAGGYSFLCAIADKEHILPGTTVNGTDLGDMTYQQAIDQLQKKSPFNKNEAQITVTLDGNSYTFAAGEALELDCESAAKKALGSNPDKFWLRGLAWLKAFFQGNPIEPLPLRADTESLYSLLAASGFPDPGTYVKQPYQIQGDRLVFTAGAKSEKIDQEALTEAIIRTCGTQSFREAVACPLTPSETAGLEQIYQAVHKDPENATLDPQNNYAIVEGKPGIDFDKEKARAALDTAKGGQESFVDLIYPKPEITAKKLRKRMFSDTLATYTTKVGGTSNCVSNIKLAAEKCDGAILPAGYEFSFNNAVGEQTAATGFKTADAILDGRIIQAYGGGICQVSTTIFAAALYANLDILEHWNHDYVSSYIEAGMDAAVAWGVLDMRIGNSFSYPVKLDVRCTGDNLTVTILGTKTDDSYVEVETEVLKNSPPHTLEIVTHRNVYSENGRHFFTEKAAYSSYVQ